MDGQRTQYTRLSHFGPSIKNIIFRRLCMKKVIMILIDAIMPDALENSIKAGKAKALKFLMENGYYDSKLVTAFPTMTASVDCTLMTGVYPDQHKVPGLIWYHPEEKRIVDYVNGSKTTLSLGIKNTANDVLVELNEKHLNKETKTIYEELAEQGKTAGAINFIIHRGFQKYELKPPFLFNLITRFKLNKRSISGPELLSIGAFVKPSLPGRKLVWNWNQSLFNKYGINDRYAIEVTKYIIEAGRQPDFLMIYLPNHDHYLHKHINHPLESIKKVDQNLEKILDTFGDWNKAIEQNTFIILGDHGQTEIGKEQNHNIDLDYLLRDYQIPPIGQRVKEEHEAIFANNERMVYIYPLKKDIQKRLVNTLLAEENIDFIAWKENKTVKVANANGAELTFSKGKESYYIDPYHQKWDVEGDLTILDITLEKNQLHFGQFPDALSRLYGALYSQNIPVIVANAKPHFEFISKTFPTHLGGGSHGSLNYTDSIVPLLVAGAEKNPPTPMRVVDLKNYVLQLLNSTSTSIG